MYHKSAKHILIVEDEVFLARALKDNLKANGLPADIAMNGDEAIECVGKKIPRLILLDLLMPKRDGYYVLEELKKNLKWKEIPVIVLSNLGGEAEIKRAMDLGADDYLMKSENPIDIVIKKVLSQLTKKKR